MENEPDPQRECPECGGETVWDDDAEEIICLECGFVLEEVENGKNTQEQDSSNEEWTAFDSTEGYQDTGHGQSAPPETVAEWKMWYPCPACDSTELNQIIESHLSVRAKEDGSYGGENSVEELNYVECDECGEVLLDEIGKSS